MQVAQHLSVVRRAESVLASLLVAPAVAMIHLQGPRIVEPTPNTHSSEGIDYGVPGLLVVLAGGGSLSF